MQQPIMISVPNAEVQTLIAKTVFGIATNVDMNGD
jgi:hypothetical protein